MTRSISLHLTFLAALLVASIQQAARAQTVEGGRIVVTGSEDIIATYLGNTASFDNDLYLESPPNSIGRIFANHGDPIGAIKNLGSFPIGTELIFRLHVNNTGEDFFSGPAVGNPDNHTHARVTYDFGPDTTLVEFEDLLNGPFDYNDLSFSFSNTNLPEPTAAMALLFIATRLITRRRR